MQQQECFEDVSRKVDGMMGELPKYSPMSTGTPAHNGDFGLKHEQ